VSDMIKTKGHVAAITGSDWLDDEHFASSSLDGSVRIWDVNSMLIGVDQLLTQQQVIKAKSSKKSKLATLCVTVSPNGELIAAACEDFTIQIWLAKSKSNYRPQYFYADAHSGQITSITWFNDSKRFISRSQDGSIKIWTLALLTRPLLEIDNIPTRGDTANVAIS